MRKLLTGVLVAVPVAVLSALAAFVFVDRLNPTADTMELPPMQIYAGDPVPKADRSDVPALYVCTDDEKDGLFLVIAPTTYEFMVFDRGGAWLNNGQFFEAKTDKGVQYLHAEIGTTLLGFYRLGESWKLAVVSSNEENVLVCN